MPVASSRVNSPLSNAVDAISKLDAIADQEHPSPTMSGSKSEAASSQIKSKFRSSHRSVGQSSDLKSFVARSQVQAPASVSARTVRSSQAASSSQNHQPSDSSRKPAASIHSSNAEAIISAVLDEESVEKMSARNTQAKSSRVGDKTSRSGKSVGLKSDLKSSQTGQKGQDLKSSANGQKDSLGAVTHRSNGAQSARLHHERSQSTRTVGLVSPRAVGS